MTLVHAREMDAVMMHFNAGLARVLTICFDGV
jgi:hypothetical protein